MSLKWYIIALAIVCRFPSICAASACGEAQSEYTSQACTQNPDELVRQAASLNADKRYTEAADLMERLLMQHPETAGAVEQYNQALAGINRTDSIQTHIQPAKPDLPPQQWQINTGLQMQGGYSDNLNQAPTQSTILLGSVPIELSSQFRQQAGFGFETQLTGNAVRTFADSLQWQVRGELFNRETDYNGYANYQGANLLTSLMTHGDSGTETGGAFGFNALRYDGNIYLYTGQVMLRHAGKKGAYCQPQAGVDLLWQRQQGHPLLDSRYGGLMAGILCDTKIGLYSASISAGWDWASSLRPGGDQQRAKLEATGIWPTDIIAKDSFLKAHADFLQSNDMQPYSALLSNGASRYTNRIGLKLDYDWSLNLVAKNWRGVTSIKWQNQNSNISLFDTNTLEGWLGVRILW